MDAQITPVLTSQEVAGSTTLSDQMDSILRIAELLEKGVRNTGALMRELGCSRPTAIKYRNEALKILAQENKAFNTNHMRALEIGRLNYWIDWLQNTIERLGDDKDDREYKNKLLGRLDNFQGRLHAITALNTTVNLNYEEKKRIVFNMGGEQKPADPSPLQAVPTEGEIIDQGHSS